jgi:hypothetical protein
MGDKNEDIYLFILEEERRKNRERALRGKTQEATEQLVAPPQKKAITDELHREQTLALSHTIQPMSKEQESSLEEPEHVEIAMEPLRSVTTRLVLKGQNRRIALGMIACSLISIVALLCLGLCASGLQLSSEWATTVNMILMGMLSPVIIMAALFQMHVLRVERKECTPA